MAAVAPVTDWRLVAEFADVRDDPDVAGLALDHWAESLAGRPVHIVIGSADRRVGCEACVRFVERLLSIEAGRNLVRSDVELAVMSDCPGHGVTIPRRDQAVRFLLDHAART